MTVATHAPRVRGPAVATDLLRLVALASVVLGLVTLGAVAGALFFLVLGGTMLPRVLDAPVALDASYCAVILFGAWAAELDWYLRVGWLDVVVHAAATGLVACMVHLLLVRLGALTPPGGSATLPRSRLGTAVSATALGVGLAVLWELGEWFGHTYLDERIQVGYTDTMGDLAAGLVGALLAGTLLARGLLSGGARQ